MLEVTVRYERPAVLAWESFKNWLSSTVHLTHHQLHVILGLLLFLSFSRLLRQPLTSFWPLLPVLVLEVVNETSDYVRYRIDNWPWTPGATLYDILLTLGPPFMLALAARIWTCRRAGR